MYVCIVHVRLPVLARRCCEAMSGGLTLSKSQPAGYLSYRGANRWLKPTNAFLFALLRVLVSDSDSAY